jgi:uncharacterized membrane protein YkvI
VLKIEKRALGIMNCYIGALIGAGFASGQELFQFFVRFGYKGLLGVVMAGLLFAALGVYILAYKYKTGITSYNQLLTGLLGRTWGKLTDIFIGLMLFAGLVIMLAGCQATLKQQFSMDGIPALTTSFALILFTMSQGEKGVLQFNNILIPFLGVITILVSSTAILNGWGKPLVRLQTNFAFGNWFLAALLYVSYNMVLGAVILSSLEVSRRSHLWGGLLGGLGLGILAFVIVLALMLNYNYILGTGIPMLSLAQDNPFLKVLYALVLLAAMLTTAVANLYALIKRLGNLFCIPTMLWVLAILISASLLTPFGFTKLIANLYPFFGYLGFILLGGIMVSILQTSLKYAKYYFKR